MSLHVNSCLSKSRNILLLENSLSLVEHLIVHPSFIHQPIISARIHQSFF